MRIQITLNPEQRAKVKQRAATLGVSWLSTFAC